MHIIPIKNWWYHHDFRKTMSCEWINLEEYNAEGFEVQLEISSPRRKRKIGIAFIFIGVNNDTRKIMTRMNQHLNRHNL